MSVLPLFLLQEVASESNDMFVWHNWLTSSGDMASFILVKKIPQSSHVVSKAFHGLARPERSPEELPWENLNDPWSYGKPEH